MPGQEPIFLAGADRSGIGLLGDLLSEHPRIHISRRTRFWNFYYERFGDLRQRENLVAAVDEMLRYTRITDLQPDRDRLLAEFRPEPDRSGYGTLFALLQQHHLEHLGKERWGDKTLNAERYADVIFREYPTARMIHVIRDPRDRYASQAHHRNASRGKVGAGAALWRSSARLARRNLVRFRGRYRVVRYEDLASRPVEVLSGVCDFIGEPWDDRMLDGAPAPPRCDGDDVAPAGLATTSIGRFRRDLTGPEVAFIQLSSGRPMRAMGYEPVAVPMRLGERVRFVVGDVPINSLRMVAWWANTARSDRIKGTPSGRRTAT